MAKPALFPPIEGGQSGVSREAAFVRACLAAYFDEQQPAPMGRNLDWQTLFDIARLSKTGNFLLAVLSRDPQRRPAGILMELLAIYRSRTVRQNGAALADATSVSTALMDAGIDCVLFNGPVQQGSLYGDHFVKPSRDTDVLVPRGSYRRARAVLHGLGYSVEARARSGPWIGLPGEQHMVRDWPRSSTVDLRYRLQQPGSPGPRTVAPFLRHRRHVDVGGAPAPMISTGDSALLAAINIVRALLNREPAAGHACDLRAALDRLDSGERAALTVHAIWQGLEPTLLAAARISGIVCGRERGGWLSDRATGALPFLNDRTLLAMAMTPHEPDIAWPQRRTLLWELCARNPARYLAEAGWAAASEMGRRLKTRAVQTRPDPFPPVVHVSEGGRP